MRKRIVKYKLWDLRLFNNLPVLLAFLAFWVVNPVSAYADSQISLTKSENNYTSLSQEDSNIQAVNVHNFLEISTHNFPDSILTGSEIENVEENEEDDKEDNKEDNNFAALKRRLLLKDIGYNQLYNQQVYLYYQRKKLPLYLLFHSWKSHLI